MTTRMTLLAVTIAAGCAHRAGVDETPTPLPLQAELVWYALPGGEFSVLMPPNAWREEKTRAIAGAEVAIHVLEAMPVGARESYMVSYAGFPPELLKKASTAEIIDGVQHSMLRDVGGQLVTSKELVAEDMPGREFQVHKAGQGNILARVLVGNDGIFTIVATYRSAQPPDAVLRFESSFSRRGSAASADPSAQRLR